MSSKKKTPIKSHYVWILRSLALAGLAVMVYLARLHFTQGVSKGSVCELGEGLSCEAVNTSVYSELLGIPVAFLGVGYFALLLFLSLSKLTKERWQGIFLLTVFVLVPSLYLSSLEIFVINSICVFCELSKILMVAVLAVSGLVLKKTKRLPKSEMIVQVFIAGLLAAGIIWFLQTRDTSDKDYTDLAQCIAGNSVLMYGSFTCSACAREREVFGDAFQYITEIECNPRGEHAQTELCLEKKISHTPTFIQEIDGEEIKRVDGFQSPEDLAIFAGCEDTLPVE